MSGYYLLNKRRVLQAEDNHMEQISMCSHGGAHGAAVDVAWRRLQPWESPQRSRAWARAAAHGEGPQCGRRAGRAAVHGGPCVTEPYWSSSWRRGPWYEPMLEQCFKNCSLWEVNIRSAGEGQHPVGETSRGAEAESDHGGAAQTEHYGLTASLFPYSPVLLVGRR